MIYLHHYPASLFSEKIRLLLGHYQLSWHSVEIAPIMPRPLLMPLSGGYRRTPVLQLGANVYSDTKVICRALARHAGDERLYAPGFAAHRVADWADSQLFRVIVALNFAPEALGAMMGNFTPEQAQAFAKDRAALAGNAPIASMTPAAARAWLQHACEELESSLSANRYLFGDDASIADFALAHNFWFLRNNPVNAPLLDRYEVLLAWLARMEASGHGDVQESTGEAALAAARAATPTTVSLHQTPDVPAPGASVTVTPIDYGCIPVAGTLVAADHAEVIIERHTEETGTVHNHFPMAGFEVALA